MADFSADKQDLQKTLAVFDTDVKVEDVVGYSSKYEPYQSTDVLFLQTVLEVCCSFVEPNPILRKHLFTVLEALLVREKIISPNIRFESLTDIRRKSAKQFIVSLNELRSSLIPSPKDSIAIPKLLDGDHTKKYPNTYEENFVELRVIAEGGFGTVCMARHKVDGLTYAIKKIIFNFERERDFTKVMSEVKSISTLSHKNIVSYKNCWIQLPYNLEESTGVAAEGYSESLHSVSQKFNGVHHRKGKPKCATLLNFAPKATSSPCSENPKNSKECLLQRILSYAHSTGVSRSICPNKSPKSSSTSVFDRTIDISKSESDCSIVCDLPSDNFAQGSVSAGPSIIITDSSSNNSTASAESWMSSPEHTTELDQRNFWNTTPSSLVSAFANLDIKSSQLSTSTDSWVTNSSHNRTISELQTGDGILFSDSYRNDSLHDVTSTSDAPDNPLSVTNSETLSADSADSDSDDASSDQESVQSVVFRDSFENASVENSILSNGDFSESVDVSRCKTSGVTRCSTLSRAQSTTNDSVVCYDSTRNASSLDYPYKFKMKFRAMLCIQMEYCDCDLRLWMDQRNNGDSLPFQKDVKDIFKEIVTGVAYIHSKSIIHRDLKPQNIFYSEKDNSMKIGDFGLATLGHSSPNRHGVVNQHFTSDLGTYPYAAPEQMRKHDYDNKVDIYSLGIILIELLLPFRTRSEFFHTIPQIVRGDMPKELTSQWPCYVKLLENLVQKRPALRMTAREILDLPVMQDDAEVDRRLLVREIEDLKKALEDKDKEFKDALNGKNAIIESLRLEIKELSNVVKNLKSKKSRKKH